MATTELQITPQQRTIKDLFTSARESIQAVVPKHLDPERMMRVALVAISRNSDLLACTPQSLLKSFMEAGELGLTIGGSLGEAYLVPYWNKNIRAKEATFIPGYRGLATLAMRSDKVVAIDAHVVRVGDAFSYEYGTNSYLTHRPASGAKRDLTHAYAIATMSDGTKKFVVLDSDEVGAVRSRSQCADSGPWVTDEAEMWKKTAVRRLSKLLPLSPEAQEAIDRIDRNEFGDFNVSVQEQIRQPRRVSSRTPEQIGAEQPPAGDAPPAAQDSKPEPKREPTPKAKQAGADNGEPDDRPVYSPSYAEQMHDGDEARIQGTLAWDAETKGKRTSFKLRHDEGGQPVVFSTFYSAPDGMVKGAVVLFTCKANAKDGKVFLNAEAIEVLQ